MTGRPSARSRPSYPQVIGTVAVLFIVLIFLLALVNLYISIHIRSAYLAHDARLAHNHSQLLVSTIAATPDSVGRQLALRRLKTALDLDRVAITDAAGNLMFDSGSLPYGMGPAIDLAPFLTNPPRTGSVARRGGRFFANVEDTYFVYLEGDFLTATLDPVFSWHITYITVSLLCIAFLGFYLIRNLFIPMYHARQFARRFGVEMDKEDFVSVTFDEMFHRLQSQEQQLVEYSAYIAHEFRNSLATITGLARLVEKGKKPAADIDKECRNLEGLIAALLDYARPLKPLFAPCNVRQLLTEAVSRARIPTRVTTEIVAAEELTVSGDYDLLAAALDNLFQNSRDAIKGKGRIWARAHQESDQVIMTIGDTGAGIAREDLDKIFSLYFSSKESGIGLGLAYVRKVIDIHGGRITVHSDKGKGTEFTIVLPVRTASAPTLTT